MIETSDDWKLGCSDSRYFKLIWLAVWKLFIKGKIEHKKNLFYRDLKVDSLVFWEYFALTGCI